MSNKTLIITIILIIVGLGLFVVGGYSGVIYQQEKDKPFEKAANVLSCFGSSKIISSIVVVGQVTKISGRTITLSYGAENFSIDLKEYAQIYSNSSGVKELGSFEEIKVGDSLSVSVRVLSDGQLQVLGVTILQKIEMPAF